MTKTQFLTRIYKARVKDYGLDYSICSKTFGPKGQKIIQKLRQEMGGDWHEPEHKKDHKNFTFPKNVEVIYNSKTGYKTILKPNNKVVIHLACNKNRIGMAEASCIEHEIGHAKFIIDSQRRNKDPFDDYTKYDRELAAVKNQHKFDLSFEKNSPERRFLLSIQLTEYLKGFFEFNLYASDKRLEAILKEINTKFSLGYKSVEALLGQDDLIYKEPGIYAVYGAILIKQAD